MATLPWVRLSSIVGVYWSDYSKSPDTGLHSRVAFAPPIASHRCVFGGIWKEHVHEEILVPPSRLRLWTDHPDLAHHARADADCFFSLKKLQVWMQKIEHRSMPRGGRSVTERWSCGFGLGGGHPANWS